MQRKPYSDYLMFHMNFITTGHTSATAAPPCQVLGCIGGRTLQTEWFGVALWLLRVHCRMPVEWSIEWVLQQNNHCDDNHMHLSRAIETDPLGTWGKGRGSPCV